MTEPETPETVGTVGETDEVVVDDEQAAEEPDAD